MILINPQGNPAPTVVAATPLKAPPKVPSSGSRLQAKSHAKLSTKSTPRSTNNRPYTHAPVPTQPPQAQPPQGHPPQAQPLLSQPTAPPPSASGLVHAAADGDEEEFLRQLMRLPTQDRNSLLQQVACSDVRCNSCCLITELFHCSVPLDARGGGSQVNLAREYCAGVGHITPKPVQIP